MTPPKATRRSRLALAMGDISRFLASHPTRVFTERELAATLDGHRATWRLPASLSAPKFIDALQERGELTQLSLSAEDRPHLNLKRYAWGPPSPFASQNSYLLMSTLNRRVLSGPLTIASRRIASRSTPRRRLSSRVISLNAARYPPQRTPGPLVLGRGSNVKSKSSRPARRSDPEVPAQAAQQANLDRRPPLERSRDPPTLANPIGEPTPARCRLSGRAAPRASRLTPRRR